MPALSDVLTILRSHESELRRLGAAHTAVFGSVARGEANNESDIDILVDLDHDKSVGVFEYAEMTLYIRDLLAGKGHVSDRETLKPLLREDILRDAVSAF